MFSSTTEAPPTLRRLLSLAWPIVISRSSQTLVGVADTVMVAPLGESALAAVTTGALNMFNLLILPMGVVFIVQSFAAQLFGQGDAPGARRYGWYGLGVALVTQGVCLVTAALVGRMLGVFNYTPEVRAVMSEYLVWRLPSAGAAIGIEALANYYGGIGNTRLPMVASVLAMLLNVLGNWLLIGGELGCPALGVRGAALASSLSTGIAFLLIFCWFLFGYGCGGRGPRSRLHWHELWRTLWFGIPSGLNWFFEFLAFSFFVNVVVAGLGTTALAALMAVFQVNGVAFMPAFGIASAGAILVGQAIGAKALAHVGRAVRLTLAVTCSWQVLVGVTYALIPDLVLAPVAPRGSEVGFLAVARTVLMVSAGWQIFDAVVSSLAEALRAAGDTAFTMWARLGVAWLVFVPGLLASRRWLDLGPAGATGWVVIYLALLSGVLALRYRSGAWRRIQLIERPAGL